MSLHLSARTKGKELLVILSPQSPQTISLPQKAAPSSRCWTSNGWQGHSISPVAGRKPPAEGVGSHAGPSLPPSTKSLFSIQHRTLRDPRPNRGSQPQRRVAAWLLRSATQLLTGLCPRTGPRLRPGSWGSNLRAWRALMGLNDPHEHHLGPLHPTFAPGPHFSPAWSRLS